MQLRFPIDNTIENMELVNADKCKISVSSVLDRNAKEYGKKFLLDDREDTCWNSDQGIPQYIKLKLNDVLKSERLKLQVQFQGGFCGKECSLQLFHDANMVHSIPFYPKDNNDYQCFEFELLDGINFDTVTILMQSTTDFYGRIIVYQLSLLTY